MTLSEFAIDRYDEVLALWQRTPGICIREADSRPAIARYLARNPGLSFIAQDLSGNVIGSALSGHDGRRGYLQHVVVDPHHRGQGIAHALVTRCLAALTAEGIVKSHLEVLASNDLALRYWSRRGWQRRDDIIRYSHISSADENA